MNMELIWTTNPPLFRASLINSNCSNSNQTRSMLEEDKHRLTKVNTQVQKAKWWTVSIPEEISHLMRMLDQFNNSFRVDSDTTGQTLKSSSLSSSSNTNSSNSNSKNSLKVSYSKTNNLWFRWIMTLSKNSCWIPTNLLRFAQLFKLSDGDWPKLEERRLWNKWSTLTSTTTCWTATTKTTKDQERSSINSFFNQTDEFWNTLWLSLMLWEMNALEEVIFFKKVTSSKLS